MVSGPSLRVSWICLLLISGGVCYPVGRDIGSLYGTKGVSGDDVPFGRPAAYPLFGEADSPTGDEFTSGLETHNMAADWSPGFDLNRFVASPESNAPEAPSQGAGYVANTDASFHNPSYWIPLPPVHHNKLIQSRNGYRHASVSSSHTRYSPFYPRYFPGAKV